ncbi:hypothetical protein I4U23_005089 [Adineta vaga]|nr:hypothetical protein I4U23_005089 [Adineta vaga]
MASYNSEESAGYRLRIGDIADEPLRMLPPIQGYQNMPLVSLEEAVKPLVSDIPDVQQHASDAKKNCQKSLNHGISIDESASILLYTMEWKKPGKSLYNVLNEHLRSEDRSILKSWFLYLKLILNGLLKIPSSSRDLFRGVKLNLSAQYQNGEYIIWWAFSSCTDVRRVAEKFCGKSGERTIFELKCYSGKDVREYSRFKGENEVLLIAATQFKIVSNVNKGDGLTVIQLEETEPEYPLIEKSLVSKPNKPHKTTVHPVKTQEPKFTPLQSASNENERNPVIRRLIDQVKYNSSMIIKGQYVNKEDMKEIIEVVIMEKRCEEIQISDGQMTDESIEELGKGIRKSTSLNAVDLSNNCLTNKDLLCLAGELSVPETHTVVQWKCCGLTKMQELDSGSIKILNLSNNNIDDDGMNHLVALLRSKRTLTDLYLNNNQIGDEGIEKFAKALSHSTSNLQKLYLNNNSRITNRSANYLAEMLKKNQSLNTLWLLKCGFSDGGRQKLMEAAALKKGFYLNIERFEST